MRLMRPLTDFPAPPFPRDATMFFCIGAQKAGTTWLYDYLSRSEEVHFSRNKELHYFDVRAGRGKATLKMRIDALHKQAGRLDPKNAYLNRLVINKLRDITDLLSIHTGKRSGVDRHAPYLDYLLAGRTNQPLVGDVTPAYAVLRRKQFADMASIGRAKFIFILRDPVSRMWSQIRMAVDSKHGADITLEERTRHCVEHARMLVDAGRLSKHSRANYARTMTELEAVVPTERILYVFYEDLFVGSATRQICDFLDIAHYPPEAEKRVNQGISVPLPGDIRSIFRQAFAPQYEAMRARFGDRIPDSWMD
ncbi:sulfotransferase [Roseovarius sp. A-2]|uniref:sulfotransferase n=1 Tax=Roseovarius sp. A-2 TaxID=1570360 RepID=UPI0020CB1A93|nr:sulfotransferase [Roseovarius sp. A-2]